MKKTQTKRGNLYKIFHILVMITLVLNMSMIGLFANVDEARAELPVCGDGVYQPENNEDCDNGVANYPEGTMDPVWDLVQGSGDRTYCSDICYVYDVAGTWCGDGDLQSDNEDCDDGNNIDNDGCSATCEDEVCTAPTSIVINEIMQNPNVVDDTDGEWFELYNAGSESVDLNGCVISDNGSDSPHTINASLVVPADGYAVLARNADFASNGGVTVDYEYAGIDIGNTDDEIVITCCGTEIDRVNYDDGATFPDPTGASMFLKDSDLDNNAGENWCESTSVYGGGDLGTPGAQNDTCGGGSSCTTDVDIDGICDDVDDCIDKDGDDYGYGTGCLDSDCNDTNSGMQDRLCCYVDKDEDYFYQFYGYESNDGVTRGEFCYCTGGEVNEICSDLTEKEVLGEDCDDTDPTQTDDCENPTPDEVCDDAVDNDGDGLVDCDDSGCVNDPVCEVEESSEITIKAYKVVCESEIYLPNWGEVELISNDPYNEPNLITSNTAADYVSRVNDFYGRDVCWLQEDWKFQWGFDDKTGQEGVDKAGSGDFVGEADGTTSAGLCGAPYCGPNTYTGTEYSDWKTFGPTDSNGETSVTVSDIEDASSVWVREVLQDGFIPFTYPTDGPREDNVTAELYCYDDILNYDNFDHVINVKEGGVYNCVAFNAPKRVKINAFKVVCKDEMYLPNWGQVELIPGEPERIQFDTAETYVANINELNKETVCWLDDDWQFQWGYNHTDEELPVGDGVHKSMGDLVGESDGTDTTGYCPFKYCGPNTFTGLEHNQWKTMEGYTSSNGMISMAVDEADLIGENGIWVREVLQDGYVPYTYPPDGARENDYSAELYCEDDIVNYDNYDLIKNLTWSGVYNCIAFNAPKNDCDNVVEGYKYNSMTQGGVEGWTIYLASDDGQYQASTTTNVDGYYSFDNICDGSYVISEEERFGWEKSSPEGDYTVVLPEVETRGNYDFNNYPMICGHKYDHGNNNQVIDGWRIDLYSVSEVSTLIDTAYTNSAGEYCFNVKPGMYQVEEEIRDTWYAFGGTSYIEEFTGEEPLLIDFYNYQLSLPICGNGVCDAGEDANNCCDDCGSCGGSVTSELIIFNERISKSDGVYTITWQTNKFATSRVVYDTDSYSVSELVLGDPNFGYTYTTSISDEDPKVTGHTVVISGLEPGTTYYFRPISTASPAKYGIELTLTTDEAPVSDEIQVLGEEGAPVLEVTKVANKDSAKPGDEIEFTITVKNTGNLTAFEVSLKDILPKELSFLEFEGTDKTWNLGDIEPQASKEIKVKTVVSKTAPAGVYSNTTEVSAVNHETMLASDDYEVEAVSVLADTGFDIKELFLILLSLAFLVGGSRILRQKIS